MFQILFHAHKVSQTRCHGLTSVTYAYPRHVRAQLREWKTTSDKSKPELPTWNYSLVHNLNNFIIFIRFTHRKEALFYIVGLGPRLGYDHAGEGRGYILYSSIINCYSVKKIRHKILPPLSNKTAKENDFEKKSEK